MALNPTDATIYIDFGGGWRYGFPKIYVNPNNLSIREYLISQTVPDWLATQEANNIRMWTHPEGSVPIKPLEDMEKAFES